MNIPCSCGHVERIAKSQTRLRFVKAGHTVQHSRAWCAEIERWPDAQTVVCKLHQRSYPTPMLFTPLVKGTHPCSRSDDQGA